MFDSIYNISCSDSSDDEEIINYVTSRKKKTFRSREDFFSWDDIDFETRFRMSKETICWLTELIKAKIKTISTKNRAVSPLDQVLLTMRFFATGTIQQCTGDLYGLHKSTVCRITKKVTRAIAQLRPLFIKMPDTEEKQQKCSYDFYKMARFPNVIGAIDCTHVPIISPGGENAEYYRNRKDIFSVNVQAVVNADMSFMDVVARWPGSSHDSTIFNNSRLKCNLERGAFGQRWLVGDGGYASKPYMMTPLRSPQLQPEKLYNESQIRTRNVVERTFGVWKRRFPAVGSKLRVKLNKVEAIIIATAVLHNICILRCEQNFEADIDATILEEESNFDIIEGENQMTRNNLIRDYFSL